MTIRAALVAFAIATTGCGSGGAAALRQPDEYTGKKNQLVIPGPEVVTMSSSPKGPPVV